MSRAPGWLPDPTRRHELRYWDGGTWTADVADEGVESFDPSPVPLTPPPDAAPPEAAAEDPGYGWAGSTQPGTGLLTPAGGTPMTASGPPPGPPPERPMFAPPAGPAGPSPGSSPRSSRPVLLGLVALLLVAGAGVAIVLATRDDDGQGSSTAARGTGEETTSSTSSTSTSTTTSTTLDPAAAMVDSIVAGVLAEAGDVITEAQAECMALQLVDEVGVERLHEVGDAVADDGGINPLGLLTPEEQEAALARMRTCVDAATLDELAPGGE